MSRGLVDLPTTIRHPNSPFHPCIPTFPLAFSSLHKKPQKFCFFHKQKMVNKTTSFFTCFLLMYSGYYSFYSEPSSDVSSIPAQVSAINFRGRSSYRKSCKIPVTVDPFKKTSSRGRVNAAKMSATCKERCLIEKSPS